MEVLNMAFASLKVHFRISGGLRGVARYLTTLLLIKFQNTPENKSSKTGRECREYRKVYVVLTIKAAAVVLLDWKQAIGIKAQ